MVLGAIRIAGRVLLPVKVPAAPSLLRSSRAPRKNDRNGPKEVIERARVML
jgi:hypothetical protein